MRRGGEIVGHHGGCALSATSELRLKMPEATDAIQQLVVPGRRVRAAYRGADDGQQPAEPLINLRG